MNRRVCLAQILLYFFMLMFLVASPGCGKGDDNIVNELRDDISQHLGDNNDEVKKYTASGTYTYSDGTLIFTWTSSDFTCNGPEAGTETNTGAVGINDITMQWSNGNSTWERENGTTGDPIGDWKTLSDQNTYTLNIRKDGTMTLSATNVLCDTDNATYGTQWQH